MRSVKKNQNILAPEPDCIRDSCSPDSSSPEAGSIPDKSCPETGSIPDKSCPEADSIEHKLGKITLTIRVRHQLIKVTIKKTA